MPQLSLTDSIALTNEIIYLILIFIQGILSISTSTSDSLFLLEFFIQIILIQLSCFLTFTLIISISVIF